jgi:hypothetical protein
MIVDLTAGARRGERESDANERARRSESDGYIRGCELEIARFSR